MSLNLCSHQMELQIRIMKKRYTWQEITRHSYFPKIIKLFEMCGLQHIHEHAVRLFQTAVPVIAGPMQIPALDKEVK